MRQSIAARRNGDCKMAMTRKFLKALGIEDDKIDQIIEAHTDTINALKDERDTYKADAESLPAVAKERDKLQKDIDDLKAKAPDAAKVQAEFDAFKLTVEAEKANASKAVAVEAALKAAGANETAVKLMLKEIDLSTVELDGNTVKNADKVIEPIKAAYAGLFGTQQQQGVPPATPPKGNAPDYDKLSDEDYYKAVTSKKKE